MLSQHFSDASSSRFVVWQTVFLLVGSFFPPTLYISPFPKHMHNQWQSWFACPFLALHSVFFVYVICIQGKPTACWLYFTWQWSFLSRKWVFLWRELLRVRGFVGFWRKHKKMVPRAGVEPAWVVKPGGFWVHCVCQFRHLGTSSTHQVRPATAPHTWYAHTRTYIYTYIL